MKQWISVQLDEWKPTRPAGPAQEGFLFPGPEFWLRAFVEEVEKRAAAVDVKRRNARIAIAFDQLKRGLLGD
jgi:hypothetical protein